MQFVPKAVSPILSAYAITSLVLCLNLLVLWLASGGKRAQVGGAINPEDGARYGVAVVETDPPAVARYLRAHRNAEATIYPFLVLGLVYVLVGGAAGVAIPIFAVFVLARIAHSIVYLRALQPWRSITFGLSLLAIIALMVAIVLQLVRG